MVRLKKNGLRYTGKFEIKYYWKPIRKRDYKARISTADIWRSGPGCLRVIWRRFIVDNDWNLWNIRRICRVQSEIGFPRVVYLTGSRVIGYGGYHLNF